MESLTLRQKQEVIDLIKRLVIRATHEGQKNNIHIGLYIDRVSPETMIDESFTKILTGKELKNVIATTEPAKAAE